LRPISLQAFALTAGFALLGCSSSSEPDGGSPQGGSRAAGGASSTAGSLGKGGTASGGAAAGAAVGGYATGAGGAGPVGTSGGNATGGTGGNATSGTGGIATGGNTAAGGSGFGGRAAGGSTSGGATSGGAASGGIHSGGAASGGGAPAGGAVAVDCSVPALTGGTQHSSSNASGTAAGLSWTIWSNGSGGSITTYTTPAFSAAWNNSGDFLARTGLQWNDSKTYDQFGTITAEFAETKSGAGGGYSYIGIYGWSVSPCIEYYIVDDSYNKMPVNPGNTTNKGTASIDGGTYNLYSRATSGTGGSKCAGVSSWTQFYSVRQTARQCGQISITEHFKAWAAAGMTLGKMDQAQILVEVGGGSGKIDFTTASVTAQ
jgi:endo-1,4-beta-xylanase